MYRFQHFVGAFSFSAHSAIIACALASGSLFIGANCRAQQDFYWAGSASGVWQDASKWLDTNGVAGVDYPGHGSINDNAWFTNAGTFNITFNADVADGSNTFNNPAGTTAQWTIDASTFQWNPTPNGNGIVVGRSAGATTVVYVVHSTGSINIAAGTSVVGQNGFGKLVLTNTQWLAANGDLQVGQLAGTGSGLVIASGSNTFVNVSHLEVGASGSGGNSTVIISNSASLTTANFRLGCSSGGATSNNTMIVDGIGSQIVMGGGHSTVGKRGGTAAAINNALIFKNGGSGSGGNHSFAIGYADNDTESTPPSVDNYVLLPAGCAFTNLNPVSIRAGNELYLYGSTFGGVAPFSSSVTNEGLIQGWGTIQANVIMLTNASLVVSNQVGALHILHNLVLTSDVVQVALGTSYNPIVVDSNVLINTSTLNIIDSGGFGNGTYTLISYSGTLSNASDVFAIGTTPYPAATYTVDTNTAGQVNLIVSGITAGLPFQITSITRSGNDVTINYNTKGSNGQTNFVQASSGSVANGSYPGTFVDIGTNVIAGTTASFMDTGGATNKPARYYRVRSPQ